MKYLLINQQTAEETLCNKVTIDGFDYYVCNKKPFIGDKSFLQCQGVDPIILTHFINCEISHEGKKVILTNNPNIDAFKQIACTGNSQFDSGVFHGFVACYHKSQETHPFSEEDMIEFAEWVDNMGYRQVANGLYKSINDEKGKLTKELLQLWKEQQPKKIYYTQTTAK